MACAETVSGTAVRSSPIVQMSDLAFITKPLIRIASVAEVAGSGTAAHRHLRQKIAPGSSRIAAELPDLHFSEPGDGCWQGFCNTKVAPDLTFRRTISMGGRFMQSRMPEKSTFLPRWRRFGWPGGSGVCRFPLQGTGGLPYCVGCLEVPLNDSEGFVLRRKEDS